jgi:hypothetical protein
VISGGTFQISGDREQGDVSVVFQDLVGTTGTLSVGTRGRAGKGEVLLQVNGAPESFLATSDEPLPKGAAVLVVQSLPHRTVVVVPWIDPDPASPADS